MKEPRVFSGLEQIIVRDQRDAGPGGRVSALGESDLGVARPSRRGWALLAVGFGGFLAWASLAPLDQGVTAPGQVVVSGSRKAVQPLAGGLVSAILVKEGDRVKAGQPLVRFDSTATRSQLEVARAQWIVMQAVEARLTAERLGRTSISYPGALLAIERDPRARDAIRLQNQLFATRRAALDSELSLLHENALGLEAQIKGLEEAREAKREQQRIAREELRNQKELADEGYLPRNRVLEQERMVAQISASIAEDLGNIGRARQQIAEIQVKRISRQQEFRKEVETELTDVQKEVRSLASKIEALEFEVNNTEIRSPTEGVVVGLAVHTVGGVVQAGTNMMDIVPENENLRIDAQVPPDLIDKVQTGLDVDIRFPAFNQATTPRIPGIVKTVSADALYDQESKVTYYKAQVEVTAEGMGMLGKNQIKAGMPAEAFILTGERTMLNYLFKPMADRIRSAFNEE